MGKYFINERKLTYFMVGFNRRFAPHTVKIKSLLNETNKPLSFIYTVNAGFLPNDHWLQNKKIGGGRIIGEVCHFVDLLRFLVGQGLSDCDARLPAKDSQDSAVIHLTFEDGSFGTIHYLTNGNKGLSKGRNVWKFLLMEKYCNLTILKSCVDLVGKVSTR